MIRYRRPLNFLIPFIVIFVKPIYQVVSPCPGTKTHFLLLFFGRLYIQILRNDCIVLILIISNLLFQDSIIHSICSTHDIDFFCHMNNAKYFKELDFARFDFYFRSGLSDYVEARKEIYVVQHAAMIRYRRPLNFLMPFIVKTKMVYYDERSLYFEQTFISKPDNFIRAVALCKNTIGCDYLNGFI